MQVMDGMHGTRVQARSACISIHACMQVAPSRRACACMHAREAIGCWASLRGSSSLRCHAILWTTPLR